MSKPISAVTRNAKCLKIMIRRMRGLNKENTERLRTETARLSIGERRAITRDSLRLAMMYAEIERAIDRNVAAHGVPKDARRR